MSDAADRLLHLLAHDRSAGLLATLARAALVIVLAAVIATVFAHHSVLHGVEQWTRDVTSRLLPSTRESVVVVDIDDEAYEAYFGETSPLDPLALRRLIDAVAQGGARAIGIDIDTSARKFASLQPAPEWPPVVWARAPRPARHGGTSGTYTIGAHSAIVGGVLGGAQEERAPHWGLPLVLADDSDRRVRRYLREVRLDQGPSLPTFASTLARIGQRGGAGAGAREHEPHARFIDYTPTDQRLRIPARDVLELAASDGWRGGRGPVAGRIVLIGGTFAGLDRHATPIGELAGVQVLANVVETELAGGGVRQPSWAKVFGVEVFMSIVLVLLFHVIHRFHVALVTCLLLALVLGPLSSLIAFGSLERWFYFSLVYLAVSAYYGRLMFTVHLVRAKHALVEAAYDTTRDRIATAWSRRMQARSRRAAARSEQ